MNALGASNGSTSAVAIEGKPRVYERATIKPNTAADIVFNGLSSATLYSKASIPTATPTAIREAIATVSPRFQPAVVATGHPKTTRKGGSGEYICEKRGGFSGVVGFFVFFSFFIHQGIEIGVFIVTLIS